MGSFFGGGWHADFSIGNGPGRGIQKPWRPVEHPSSAPATALIEPRRIHIPTTPYLWAREDYMSFFANANT